MGNSNCCAATNLDEHNNQFRLQSDVGIDEAQDIPEFRQFLLKYPRINEIIGDSKRYLSEKTAQQKLIRLADGVYYGETQAGRIEQTSRNGLGVMLYPEHGFYYEGHWKNGRRSGAGLLIEETGDRYEGEWLDDQPHGQGTYTCYGDLAKSTGIWSNGFLHGMGVEDYADGSRYEGNFVGGVKQGKGKLTLQDGSYYFGEFKSDKMEGYGVQQASNFRYTGEWSDNQMQGAARCDFFNEYKVVIESYVGQYEAGLKHGYGEYRWLNCDTFKGIWEKGAMTKNGIFMKLNQSRLSPESRLDFKGEAVL